MRLFAALEIPSTVRENLAALLESLRAVSPNSLGASAESSRDSQIHGRSAGDKTSSHLQCARRRALRSTRYARFSRTRLLPQRKTSSRFLGRHRCFAEFENPGGRSRARDGKTWHPARTAAFFAAPDARAVRASGAAGKTPLRDPGKRGARVWIVPHQPIPSDRKQAETVRRGVHYARKFPVRGGGGLTEHA